MKRNVTLMITGLCASFLSVSAIAATTSTSSSSMPAVSTGAPAATTSLTAAQKTDGAIMEMLIVADTNEVNAAQEVLKRSSNPAVKNYAQTMITTHSQNLQAVKDLSAKVNIAPIVTNRSTSLQNLGQKELTKLSSMPSSQLDVNYINAMVKGHQALLNTINDKLLPKVSNPDLKAFLTTTRATVEQHLQMAQSVQKQLAN